MAPDPIEQEVRGPHHAPQLSKQEWMAQYEARRRNALNAVTALHAKVHDGYLHEDVCAHCSDVEEGRWATWPCRTVAVIEEALRG